MPDTTILRIVRMEFQLENLETFKAVFDRSKALIRAFDGCLGLQLCADATDPAVWYTHSYWASPEHLEAYRHSELFRQTWAQTKVHFRARPQAFTLCPVERIELVP
jgi:quinol monooxygenase YgiN